MREKITSGKGGWGCVWKNYLRKGGRVKKLPQERGVRGLLYRLPRTHPNRGPPETADKTTQNPLPPPPPSAALPPQPLTLILYLFHAHFQAKIQGFGGGPGRRRDTLRSRAPRAHTHPPRGDAVPPRPVLTGAGWRSAGLRTRGARPAHPPLPQCCGGGRGGRAASSLPAPKREGAANAEPHPEPAETKK